MRRQLARHAGRGEVQGPPGKGDNTEQHRPARPRLANPRRSRLEFVQGHVARIVDELQQLLAALSITLTVALVLPVVDVAEALLLLVVVLGGGQRGGG